MRIGRGRRRLLGCEGGRSGWSARDGDERMRNGGDEDVLLYIYPSYSM